MIPAALARCEKQVADGFEQRRAELAEQPCALLREPHFRLARELLTKAAHCLSGRARRNAMTLGEDHVARPEQRQVVRDRCAYGTCTGDNDSSHASSSSRSSSLSVRNGRRTSGPIGTPRRASTTLAAA